MINLIRRHKSCINFDINENNNINLYNDDITHSKIIDIANYIITYCNNKCIYHFRYMIIQKSLVFNEFGLHFVLKNDINFNIIFIFKIF